MWSSLHRRLAYVPGDVTLWPGMTGGEAIDLLGKLRGGLDEARRRELIERFELDPTKRGRQYSKGNRQKVALVAALASDVELLILDEPTSGLDPLMEVIFQEEIDKEKARGRSVLLSSHILSEAEALADRISIIRAGKVVQTGTLEQLRQRTRTTIHAVLTDPPATLDGLRSFHDARLQDGRLTGTVDADQLSAAMVELGRYPLTALTVAPPSLEELFLRQYGTDTEAESARWTARRRGMNDTADRCAAAAARRVEAGRPQHRPLGHADHRPVGDVRACLRLGVPRSGEPRRAGRDARLQSGGEPDLRTGPGPADR